MRSADRGFELRPSGQWVLLLLGVGGVIVLWASKDIASPRVQTNAQLLGGFLFVQLLPIWRLLRRDSSPRRTTALVLLTLDIVLVAVGLDLPVALLTLSVPTMLAAALIDLKTASGFGVAHTVMAFALPLCLPAFAPALQTLTIFLVWSAAGVMAIVYRPMYQILDWSWGQYQRSQTAIQEVRDRREELEQTLKDLAHANWQLSLNSQRMAALRTAAETAERSKSAFVARVSHEFRAPLNMIIGLVGLMVDRPEVYTASLPSDLMDDLRTVHRNSTHLAEMINDVLDLTQSESGRLTLHRHLVDLRELIGEATQAIRPLIDKKGLGLDQDLPQTPVFAYCDPTRTRQVLLNLISNAARFTDEGCIQVRVSSQNGEVLTEVRDTGPGIPREQLALLFEPFTRVDTEATRKVAGSGLGLSISREIVQHHGGRIWAESDAGAGAAFYFTLPTQPVVPPTAQAGHQIVADWVWREDSYRVDRTVRADDLVRPLAVLYDAEGTLADALGAAHTDFEVVATRTPEETTAVLQAHAAQLILVNAPPPRWDDEVLRAVSTFRTEAPDTPVIASHLPNPKQRALDAGAVDYLTKPVVRSALESVLHQYPDAKTVLVVDDEAGSAALIQRMIGLCAPHLSVEVATDGADAIVRAGRHRPDLVLLDLVMPGTDGWQVLQALREAHDSHKLPVVIVSAQDPFDAPPAGTYLHAMSSQGIAIEKLLPCAMELAQKLPA